MLGLGKLTRPQTTEQNVQELVRELYGMTVTWIKELDSYVDRNYWVKVASEHNNPNVKELHQDGYILKVLNSTDSVDSGSHVGKLDLLLLWENEGLFTESWGHSSGY